MEDEIQKIVYDGHTLDMTKYMKSDDNFFPTINQIDTYENLLAKTDKPARSLWNIQEPFTFKDGKSYPANTKIAYRGTAAADQTNPDFFEISKLVYQYNNGNIKVDNGGVTSSGRLGGVYYVARINSGILDSHISPNFPTDDVAKNTCGIIANAKLYGGTNDEGCIFVHQGVEDAEGTKLGLYGATSIETMDTNASGKHIDKKTFTFPDKSGKLATEDQIVKPKQSVVSIPASAWSSSTRKATVAVEGMTADSIIIVSGAPESVVAVAENLIVPTEQKTGELVFTCQSIPTTEVKMNIVNLGA